MDFVQDLSNLNTDRYFIIGDVEGEHSKLIDMLYQQKFTYKDTLILTGNMLNTEKSASIDTLLFVKNTMNAYSVKGKNEFDFLRRNSEPDEAPTWFRDAPNVDELINFIDELPLIIKVSDYIYVVHAGIQPTKSLDEQDPEVFYSIGEYDSDSRFYQFDNPEEKAWYDFPIYDNDTLLRLCFGSLNLEKTEVPAGYSLGSDSVNMLKCLILRKDNDEPILVEL